MCAGCWGKRGLEGFAEVDAAVDYFEADGLVGLLGVFVVDPGVGGHLATALLARPFFSSVYECAAYALVAEVLVDVPAFDKADGLGGIAAVGVGAEGNFDEAG